MIFVTGDTHGHLGDLIERLHDLKSDDKLIILGDFGFLWDGSQRENIILDEISKILVERRIKLYFLDGNHENFDLLSKLKRIKKHNTSLGIVRKNIYHLPRGCTPIIEGKKFLVMGGATSIDKSSRTEFVSWWKEEIPSYTEINNLIETANKIGEVDFILTHTCPSCVFEQIASFSDKIQDPMYQILEQITHIKFKKWYFGHFHDDFPIFENYQCLYYDVQGLK